MAKLGINTGTLPNDGTGDTLLDAVVKINSNFNEIYSNIQKGPSSAGCIDTNEIPPYLDDNWWFSYNG